MYSGDDDFKALAKITNEKEVTPDFIIEEANEIWKKVKAYNIKFDDQVAAEKCMTEMRREHKEFCTSYPIVLRYMAQMGEYHPSAFRDYINHIKYHPWKSESEYLDSQADYVVRLYKAKNKKWNRTQVNNLRANIRGTLEQEHKTFKDTVSKYTEEVNAEEKKMNAKKIEELKKWYAENEQQIDDLHLRAKIDESLLAPKIDIESVVRELESELEYKPTANIFDDC